MAFGIKVSHSHRRSNRTWKPNVKRASRPSWTERPSTVYVCTRCLRSGKVTRAVFYITETSLSLPTGFFRSAVGCCAAPRRCKGAALLPPLKGAAQHLGPLQMTRRRAPRSAMREYPALQNAARSHASIEKAPRSTLAPWGAVVDMNMATTGDCCGLAPLWKITQFTDQYNPTVKIFQFLPPPWRQELPAGRLLCAFFNPPSLKGDAQHGAFWKRGYLPRGRSAPAIYSR